MGKENVSVSVACCLRVYIQFIRRDSKLLHPPKQQKRRLQHILYMYLSPDPCSTQNEELQITIASELFTHNEFIIDKNP